MTGKDKCNLLTSIRKEMADKNGIEYDPEPCKHEGECMGTCPKCDMEAEYLMNELREKGTEISPLNINLNESDNELLDEWDDDIELRGDAEWLGVVETTGDVCPKEPSVFDYPKEEETIGERFYRSHKRQINAMCETCVHFPTVRPTSESVCCRVVNESVYKIHLGKGRCPHLVTPEVYYAPYMEENRENIDKTCGGCIRKSTIYASAEGVRCSCLSAGFFMEQLEKHHCSIKRTKLEGDDLKAAQRKKEAEEVIKLKKINYANLLDEMAADIQSLCSGCVRRDTIHSTEKGIKCSCLSESFFIENLGIGRCPVKKTDDQI